MPAAPGVKKLIGKNKKGAGKKGAVGKLVDTLKARMTAGTKFGKAAGGVARRCRESRGTRRAREASASASLTIALGVRAGRACCAAG